MVRTCGHADISGFNNGGWRLDRQMMMVYAMVNGHRIISGANRAIES